MDVHTTLRDFLIQNEKYNPEELRTQMNATDESELIKILLDFLSVELKNYNSNDSTNDYEYLFKVFRYFELNYSRLSSDDFQYAINYLKKIRKLVVERIENQNVDDFYDDKLFHDKIKDNVQESILGLSFWKKQTRELDEKEQVYNFLSYLIYDVRNYNYLAEIFKTFPHLIVIEDEISKRIIVEIFEKYIEVCKSQCHNYDVIYLEKVIKLIIVSSAINEDKEYQRHIINYLYQEIDNLKREKFKKKEEEKIKFFINELLNIFKVKDNLNIDDSISNINFKYDINSTFSESVLEEANGLVNYRGEKWFDLTRKNIITIDCYGTSSFDDAFSYQKLKNGNHLLGVYISDVADLIPYNCLVDKEAFIRTETLYVPQNVLTMLPEDLAFNRLSLKAGEDRRAIAYFFEFTPNLECINFIAERAIINVKRNLRYDEINKIYEKSGDVSNLIKGMHEFAEQLKSNNIYKQKYYAVKKIKRQLDNRGYGDNFDNGISGTIVSEFMILTNHFVANYFDEQRRVPFIYRVNKFKCNDKIIDELRRKKESNCKVDEIIKCIGEIYEPSSYSVNNIGHHGLNLSAYCHTTIPVRNYASIVTQRAVVDFMIDQKAYSDAELTAYYDNLNMICDYINKRCESNEDYQTEYYKILKKTNKRY